MIAAQQLCGDKIVNSYNKNSQSQLSQKEQCSAVCPSVLNKSLSSYLKKNYIFLTPTFIY